MTQLELFTRDYRAIEEDIRNWARERDIYIFSTATAQYMKACEEFGELASALTKNRQDLIRDAIGDILVCLIHVCTLRELDLLDCLDGAYHQIKDRKGKMIETGVFLKEE